MKCIVIVLAVCVAGAYAKLSPEHRAVMIQYKDACVMETGLDPEVIPNIRKTGKINRERKLDCFFACFMKKLGSMRPDGTFDREGALRKAKEINVDVDRVAKFVDLCKDLVGKDTCETGGNIFTCFMLKKDFPVFT